MPKQMRGQGPADNPRSKTFPLFSLVINAPHFHSTQSVFDFFFFRDLELLPAIDSPRAQKELKTHSSTTFTWWPIRMEMWFEEFYPSKSQAISPRMDQATIHELSFDWIMRSGHPVPLHQWVSNASLYIYYSDGLLTRAPPPNIHAN